MSTPLLAWAASIDMPSAGRQVSHMGIEVVAAGHERATAKTTPILRPTARRSGSAAATSCALGPMQRSAVDWLQEANPFHQLVPIDWAEIARALMTLFAQSMGDPVRAATGSAILSLNSGRKRLKLRRRVLRASGDWRLHAQPVPTEPRPIAASMPPNGSSTHFFSS